MTNASQVPAEPPDFGGMVGYQVKTPLPGAAVLELRLRPHHRNRLGTVHGGVIMTMLDAAGMWACSEDGKPPGCPTVSLGCSFLKAVAPTDGAVLTARAQLLRKGSRMYFVNIEALSDTEVVAIAQGVYAAPHRPPA